MSFNDLLCLQFNMSIRGLLVGSPTGNRMVAGSNVKCQTQTVGKNVDGRVVVEHSPTSSSTDEVPLSKASETPICSGVPPCVWTSEKVTPQKRDFPKKGTIKDNLT